jgi:fucose permease
MVLSIFLVVGIDVGFNSNSGQFLMKQFSIDSNDATMGRSVYFIGRLLGTFAGAILLTRVSSRKLLFWTSVLGIISFAALLLTKSQLIAWGLVCITGVAIANIFPLVYSLSVEKIPTRSNEISGLIMMAISGGAVIPFIVGALSDISNVVIGMTVLLVCWLYLFGVSVYIVNK